MSRRGAGLLAGALLAAAASVRGQSAVSTQVWGNFILDYPHGKDSLFELDIEPKIQVAGQGTWRNVDLNPLVEYYVPFGEDASETFASKVRFRGGLGYRFNYAWRAELLYIRDANRKTRDDPFATSTNAVDVRVKTFF